MAGYEIKGQTISLKAKTDMKGKKYSPVYVSGDGEFDVATTGKTVIGVLQNEVIAGEAGQIMIDGVTMFKCADTVAAGAAVGNWGTALSAGAKDDIIAVLIKHGTAEA